MTTPKRYELRTINDIFEKIPPDRLHAFLDEFKVLADHRQRLLAEMSEGGTPVKFMSEVLVWEDDNNSRVNFNLFLQDGWIIGVTKQ